MRKSEEFKDLASKEDNDLKAMGLYIKSNREKRGEDWRLAQRGDKADHGKGKHRSSSFIGTHCRRHLHYPVCIGDVLLTFFETLCRWHYRRHRH